MIQSHARSSETSYLLFLSTSPTTWRKLPYLCRITLLRPITPTHRDSNLLTWAADLARKRFLRGGFEPAFCRLEKVGTSRVSVPQYQAFGGMDFTWTYGISKDFTWTRRIMMPTCFIKLILQLHPLIGIMTLSFRNYYIVQENVFLNINLFIIFKINLKIYGNNVTSIFTLKRRIRSQLVNDLEKRGTLIKVAAIDPNS